MFQSGGRGVKFFLSYISRLDNESTIHIFYPCLRYFQLYAMCYLLSILHYATSMYVTRSFVTTSNISHQTGKIIVSSHGSEAAISFCTELNGYCTVVRQDDLLLIEIVGIWKYSHSHASRRRGRKQISQIRQTDSSSLINRKL